MDSKSTGCLRAACLCTRPRRAPLVSHMRADGAQAMAQATQNKTHAAALRGPAHGRPDKHPARDTPSGTRGARARFTEGDLWHTAQQRKASGAAHSQSYVPLSNSVGCTWQRATMPRDMRACVSGALGWKEAAPQAHSPLQAACTPAQAGLAKCTGLFLLCSNQRRFSQLNPLRRMSPAHISTAPLAHPRPVSDVLASTKVTPFSAFQVMLA